MKVSCWLNTLKLDELGSSSQIMTTTLSQRIANRTEFQIQMGLNSNLSLHLQDSMVHIRRLKFESKPLDLAGWIVLAAGPDSNLRFSHQISQFGLRFGFAPYKFWL